jgi:hypothetical protein
MKLEFKLALIVTVALLLALPLSLVLKHRSALLNVEKSQNNNLLIQMKSKDKLLKEKDQQIQQEQQKNQELQKQIEAKKAAAAKVAAAKALQIKYTSPSCETYRPLVSQYSWNVSVAMAVMQAESGCRAITPDNAALNYDGVADHGLFQLHGIAVTDPAENVRIAYTNKYLTQGWGAWNAFSNGSYLKYL